MARDLNPDFLFHRDQLHTAIAAASDTHEDKDFETARRHLQLAARALAEMRKANADMLRWASQADKWQD